MFYSKSTGGFYSKDVHGDNMPADVVQIDPELHAALLESQASGHRIVADENGLPIAVPPPPPSADEVMAAFVALIQARLDGFARARNYDNILSACTYAGSSVAKFASEGQCAIDLRDQTWASAYEILAEVQAGTRPMPASLADIEAELPALEWPQ